MAIRAKADITISRIVDIQSVTRYYLLQSSTSAAPSKPTANPPTSSWVTTEPSYTSASTNSLYFVDCTTYTNGTFSYSEVSKSSSYEAAKVAYNKAASVESRIISAETKIEENTSEIALCATKTEINALVEGNLIVNGFGLNRDNYNFDQWTFDGTDKCDGYPSFKFTGTPRELRIPYYAVPIDKSKTYEFKMSLKGDSSKRLYLGWDEFDIDGYYIAPTYCMGISASTTTLAQDLKDGDTVVYLTSAAGWSSTTYAHQLGLIFWNYKDSTGYQYPAGVYSRNAWTNLYTFDNVDKTNNTITLTSAWNHGTFSAGTEVSQSNSGGHKYFGYANSYYPSDWTEISFIIGGVQTLYDHQSAKFNQAAKYMRFVVLHNYAGGSTSCTTSISKISLCDATLKQNLSNNYYNKSQTDAMIKVESDRITSAVSSISKNQADIAGLEVGGRNLLINTNKGSYGWEMNRKSGGYTISEETMLGVSGAVIDITEVSSSWSLVYYAHNNILFDSLKSDTEYVLSFDIYSTFDISELFFDIKDPSGLDKVALHTTSISVTKERWIKAAILIKTEAEFPEITDQYIYSSTLNMTGTIKICNLQLEEGNRATDWTPAPEDMATAEDASRAQEAAEAAQETAHEAESLIKQLADNISMLVTDGNGTSLMSQTEDGWVFSTSELQKSISSTSEGLAALTNNLSDTNSVVSVLQQAVDDLGVLSDYIVIGTYEDQPCIELGETDSEFKLRITNTQVVYTEGSTVLAYFTNQSMHIKKAVIEEELQQGGFVWKVRSNGNMGLVWKGVTS